MFFIFLLASSLAIEINFFIKHKSNQCFGDTVPENMLVVGEVMADTNLYSLRIYVKNRTIRDSSKKLLTTLLRERNNSAFFFHN